MKLKQAPTGSEKKTTLQLAVTNGDEIFKGNIVDFIYPIGSIYQSTVSTDPADIFGGTWAAMEDVFIIGASSTYTGGSTGGSKDAVVVTHNHSASSANDTHNHTIPHQIYAQDPNVQDVISGNTDDGDLISGQVTGNDTHNHTITVNSSGVSGTDKNLPPYEAVYIWKRTA